MLMFASGRVSVRVDGDYSRLQFEFSSCFRQIFEGVASPPSLITMFYPFEQPLLLIATPFFFVLTCSLFIPTQGAFCFLSVGTGD